MTPREASISTSLIGYVLVTAIKVISSVERPTDFAAESILSRTD